MPHDGPKRDLPASNPAIQGPGVGDDGGFRLIVEHAVDMIVRGDALLNRTYVSPSSYAILGYEPAELIGGNGYVLVHPEDAHRVKEALGRIGPDRPCVDLEFRMRRKNGTYVWIGARYRHLPQDNGILAVLRDITAQKRAETMLSELNTQLEAANRQLRDLVHQDGLTGIANRRRFDETIVMEFGRARREQLPVGLVLLDVDHFKKYNDRYGHIAGDDCLRRIGAAMQRTLQRPSDLAARYGGEEFVILLPATDLDGTFAMAERMRQAVVALDIEHLGNDPGVATISAGVSCMIPIGLDDRPECLVGVADGALYRAKASGRNRVVGSNCLVNRPALAGAVSGVVG